MIFCLHSRKHQSHLFWAVILSLATALAIAEPDISINTNSLNTNSLGHHLSLVRSSKLQTHKLMVSLYTYCHSQGDPLLLEKTLKDQATFKRTMTLVKQGISKQAELKSLLPSISNSANAFIKSINTLLQPTTLTSPPHLSIGLQKQIKHQHSLLLESLQLIENSLSKKISNSHSDFWAGLLLIHQIQEEMSATLATNTSDSITLPSKQLQKLALQFDYTLTSLLKKNEDKRALATHLNAVKITWQMIQQALNQNTYAEHSDLMNRYTVVISKKLTRAHYLQQALNEYRYP